MTTGGILFLVFAVVTMAVFSGVLAWGVHVTNNKD
jgi:hypothetical protein